jgi:3'(2'), 5'-bisphosphate nucleotidase
VTECISLQVSSAALERLLRIASAAAAETLRFYEDSSQVTLKTDGSPVTAADHAAHDRIVEELTAWDATVPIVSEESVVPSYEERRRWRRFWLVDPLDGTKEFLARNGEFTVNVALIQDHEPVLGVIVAPALRVAYYAGHGLGAWKRTADGHCERLSPEATPRPAKIRIVESRSHPSPRLETLVQSLAPVERVRLGSSLKFCRLAEGAADLYPRLGPTMEWDVAAGDCIYRNSGPNGTVRASTLRYNQPSLTVPEFVLGDCVSGWLDGWQVVD